VNQSDTQISDKTGGLQAAKEETFIIKNRKKKVACDKSLPIARDSRKWKRGGGGKPRGAKTTGRKNRGKEEGRKLEEAEVNGTLFPHPFT